MIDVLKDFYFVHYNFFVVTILLLLLTIFFFAKKNVKIGLVTTALLIVFNVVLYNNTAHKAWERQFLEGDEMVINSTVWDKMVDNKDSIVFEDSMKVVFAANSKKYKWVLYDSKDGTKTYHWCWFDNFWEKVSQTDLVALIWQEGNAGKKIRSASETRLQGNIE